MNRKQLGEFVREQRSQQQMTQSELAVKMKTPRRQAVMEVEKDMCDYGISVIINMLAALGYELVPIRLKLQSIQSLLDFRKIKPAKEEDDPNFEKSKENSKFVKSKTKTKQK